MRILISGATGFVGRAVVKQLLDSGHEIVVLQRPGSKHHVESSGRITIYRINLENPIIAPDLTGDAIISLSGIIREFPSKGISFYKAHYLVNKHLIDFASKRRIRRYLMMSALGVYSNYKTAYQETKYLAEHYLHDSDLNWTIFRPSLIFGPDGEFIRMLAKMIRFLPVVPVVGNGRYKLQPVWIGDVAMGFNKAIADQRTYSMTYEFGGPEILTYNQILDIIGKTLGKKRVLKIHMPVFFLRAMSLVFGRFPFFPLTNDQITMLLDDNFTEDKAYFETFGIVPKSLSGGLTEFQR
jgi:uncharacterized protein YbjT (DUF2867 family)